MNWKDRLAVVACLLFLIGLLYVAARADVPNGFDKRFSQAAHEDFNKDDDTEEPPRLITNSSNALDCTDPENFERMVPVRRRSDKKRLFLDFCSAAEDIKYTQVAAKKKERP